MHRHHELCARAVDPLEIAAGLEAHGITDRTAARFRHRDVFSLAEELYARVPRGAARTPARPRPPGSPRARRWALLTCCPGRCAPPPSPPSPHRRLSRACRGGRRAPSPWPRRPAALRRGPRSGPPGPPRHGRPRRRLWTCWLLAYAVLGDGLLAAHRRRPRHPAHRRRRRPAPGRRPGPGPRLSRPAAWCARLFAARARRKLAASRGLDDFAAAVRPLLLGAPRPVPGRPGSPAHPDRRGLGRPARLRAALALGVLLFLARLLTVHGFPAAAPAASPPPAAPRRPPWPPCSPPASPAAACLATPVEAARPPPGDRRRPRRSPAGQPPSRCWSTRPRRSPGPRPCDAARREARPAAPPARAPQRPAPPPRRRTPHRPLL